MDAVMFQKEWARMCNSYDDCKDCPLCLNGCSDGLGASGDIVEKRVEIVEKWSREHPRKTNGKVILDVLVSMGVPCVDTARYGYDRKMNIRVDADWWEEEYKKKGKTDVE